MWVPQCKAGISIANAFETWSYTSLTLQHWKQIVIMMPILLPLVSPQDAVSTCCDAAIDDKVVTMTTLGFSMPFVYSYQSKPDFQIAWVVVWYFGVAVWYSYLSLMLLASRLVVPWYLRLVLIRLAPIVDWLIGKKWRNTCVLGDVTRKPVNVDYDTSKSSLRLSYKYNGPISQILQCIYSISHNAPFRTEMCTFLFWMVHCGIWNRCIVGVVN